ncbi:hypothetical protein H2200_011573 [Cladophialophora chaetospira]|uniref:Ubiquitin 3 binding protein But2 C-terminal domain-containing protein n=1 Tax=Cladophialophora chaetospira TaxID=386627 RepID=A0AA38WZK9_9EURO|nr:hypothetical protein H2200_011573 [Cladophialophora chaetospira]
MKSSIVAAAAFTSIASATTSAYSTTGSPSSTNYGFTTSPSQYVLHADNIQTVSQALPNQAFLRSTNLYTVTPNDLALASSFTVPDFSVNKTCSLNFFVPSVYQVGGNTDIVTFSGSGNLNFSRLANNLPSSDLTFNTLGPILPGGVVKITPGQNAVIASFPCPPPGTQLPGLISSPAYGADTSLTLRDTFGPGTVTGLFLVIEPVPNPPVSPPPPAGAAPPSGSPVYTSSSHTTGFYSATSGYGTGTALAPGSYKTYSSVWHS